MALWFVTQIVENNYSVCRQQCKAEIVLAATFSSPALEVATVGDVHICYGRPRSRERQNSTVKGQVPCVSQ